MGKVFFTNSGSEANDTPVKLVWYYNNALGLVLLELNCFQPCVRNLIYRHLLSYTLTALTTGGFIYQIAAYIAKPVMGAGGVIPPPATYFDKIQPILKKYDILLIADEVICGFGRLGTMFGCDKYGIKPDLVSIAKALSSSYQPIGAVLVSPEISDVIHAQSSKLGASSHGFTYSGHPVACAVVLKALKIYKFEELDWYLAVGTEFVDNKSPDQPFPPEWGVGVIFGAECEKHGMLVRVAGNVSLSLSNIFAFSTCQWMTDFLVSIFFMVKHSETQKKR
ncbi:hypothetical protein QQ045_010804 [Rhodiola kirilowii]